jgi:hypothetical protein
VDVSYEYLVEIPEECLPVLRGIYGFMDHLLHGIQFKCSPKSLEAFVASDDYRTLCVLFSNKEAATDEDAEMVIKTLIASHPLPQNIDPQILAEVFMEIIRELRPTKAALHFTRISIRDGDDFVPSPKKFRDTLIRAEGSVQITAERIESLPKHVAECLASIRRTCLPDGRGADKEREGRLPD